VGFPYIPKKKQEAGTAGERQGNGGTAKTAFKKKSF
jgi:hypothetical protein